MGFLTEVWTGEPQDRAQETRVGNRRGVAKSGPEEMRGRTSRNPVVEGESCRLGHLEKPAQRGLPGRTPEGCLFLLSKLPAGQPQMGAEGREQGPGVRMQRSQWKRPAHSLRESKIPCVK